MKSLKRLWVLVALIAMLLTPAAMAQAGPSAAATPSAGSSPSDDPEDEVTWGTSVTTVGGESYRQALSRTERRLDPQVIRYYVPPKRGLAWPEIAGDYPLVISFKLAPKEVLNGSHDRELRTFFAATPRPSYWSYFHEPEDNIARGQFTAAAYRAAFRHIAAIADASRKPLRSTLVLMGYTAKSDSGRTWTDYYPGADVIDVLSWDCYAWTPRDTPADVFGPALRVSEKAGKPWAIAETGVTDRAAAKYPYWMEQTYIDLVTTGGVALTYFNTRHNSRASWVITTAAKREQFAAALNHSPTFPRTL